MTDTKPAPPKLSVLLSDPERREAIDTLKKAIAAIEQLQTDFEAIGGEGDLRFDQPLEWQLGKKGPVPIEVHERFEQIKRLFDQLDALRNTK